MLENRFEMVALDSSCPVATGQTDEEARVISETRERKIEKVGVTRASWETRKIACSKLLNGNPTVSNLEIYSEESNQSTLSTFEKNLPLAS